MNNKYEILKTMEEYIVNLKQGLQEVSNLFQSGENYQGAQSIFNVIDGIQWLTDALTLTLDILKEKIDISELNGKLSEIVEAFENEDYVLVGDLFQYEVLPILEEWEQNIKVSNAV